MKSFQNDSWVKTIINKSVASFNDVSCAFSALLLTITAFFREYDKSNARFVLHDLCVGRPFATFVTV